MSATQDASGGLIRKRAEGLLARIGIPDVDRARGPSPAHGVSRNAESATPGFRIARPRALECGERPSLLESVAAWQYWLTELERSMFGLVEGVRAVRVTAGQAC